MKEVLTTICENDKEIAACIMGSRRTDPYCETLNNFQVGQSQKCATRQFANIRIHFQPTDRGWPQLMRINPMLEWNCANVWEYVLSKRVPYCSLYDHGYTSIGNMKNTRPNPHLEAKGTFLPAYHMLDDSLERAGRVMAKQ